MAKKSKIQKNNKVAKLITQYAERRTALVLILKDQEASMEDKLEAQRKLQKLPRDSSKSRYRNRCGVTGRPRGHYRKFNMSRITFRELALEGKVPGVTKSSW